MRGLKDKVVIVTGAASGLGRGMARRLHEEGARVAVFDLNPAGAQQTIADFTHGLALEVDIADYQQCQAAVDEVIAAWSRVDVLINNAGWDQAGPFIESDPEVWRKIIDINLYGPLNLQHVVVPRMIEQGGGKVINIASDAGRVGSSGESVYSACKGGVIAFSKTLAREVARSGVTVNTVCPGPSDTPLFADFAGPGEQGEKLKAALARAIPLRRLGTPEDIAGLVAFLASDEAGFIVGQTISVSGGLTMHG